MKKFLIENAYIIDKRLFEMITRLNEYYRGHFSGNMDLITSLNEEETVFEVHIEFDKYISQLLDLFNNSKGDDYPFDGGDLEYVKEALISTEDQGYTFFLLKAE